MCYTTWHHNITQTHIDKGPEEPHSINTNRGHMTHHSEHTSNGSITCPSIDNYKRKRLRGLTIYKSLPRVQDRSWGNKLFVEVQAVLLVRQMSHLQNINKANVSTKVLSKTYIRSYHTCICIKKVMWGLVAASQLWSVAILFYDNEKLLWDEAAHTSPLITTSIHYYGFILVSWREGHP